MSNIVADKALQLLTQSVSDIVDNETMLATALVQALHSGRKMDLQFAQLSFEELPISTHARVHGHAMTLASNNSLH